MTATDPEPAQETWTYAGVRVLDGKRQHAWLDPGGEELLFSRTGGSMAIGSHYTAQVIRRDDGTIALRGTPVYAGSAAGSAADQATRRVLQAEHTAAQTRLELIRAERNAARRNALDEALAPLLEVAAGLRTSAERDALAVYILRKIQNAWRPPSR
jgi:hypothetical protein